MPTYGFSSLRLTLLNVCIQVQHIVPEVTIPPEVTPENVTTYIVDSGSTFAVILLVSATHFWASQAARRTGRISNPRYGKHT